MKQQKLENNKINEIKRVVSINEFEAVIIKNKKFIMNHIKNQSNEIFT